MVDDWLLRSWSTYVCKCNIWSDKPTRIRLDGDCAMWNKWKIFNKKKVTHAYNTRISKITQKNLKKVVKSRDSLITKNCEISGRANICHYGREHLLHFTIITENTKAMMWTSTAISYSKFTFLFFGNTWITIVTRTGSYWELTYFGC